MSDDNCRKCKATVFSTRSYLKRVNEKGVPGVWECAGGCYGTPVSEDDKLLSAIEGTDP